MTSNEITKLIEVRQSLKAQLDELSEQLASVEDSIKAEMSARETDLIEEAGFTVRWTHYETSRYDSTAFKKIHSDLYKAFTLKVPARRFSISEAKAA